MKTGNGADRRFNLLHVGVPIMLAMAWIGMAHFFNFDLIVTGLFYDGSAGQFTLRHHWFLNIVLRHGGGYLLVTLTSMMAAGFILSYSFVALRPKRTEILFVLLSMTLSPLAAEVVKNASGVHCPYELAMYGGYAPYIAPFAALPPSVTRGKCFPDGHAAAGFGLMAFYFVWRRRSPRRAVAALAFGLAFGFVLGFGRIMQGAHFLSDDLGAAAISWFVALALYQFILRHRPDWKKNLRKLSQQIAE